MRRFFTFALASLLVLSFCACAFADAMLYRGQRSVAAVPSVDKNSVLCVSLEDLGRALGFTPHRENDELSLSLGNAVIRVSLGAAAGWYGYSIIPLYSAPFEQDGKIWLDSKSAAALFQGLSGRGVANRLRFVKVAGQAAAKHDYGDFGTAENTQAAKKSESQENIDEIISSTARTNQNPRQQQTAKLPQAQKRTRASDIEQQEQTQSPKIAEARQSQSQQKKIRASEIEQQEQTQSPKIAEARQSQSQQKKTRASEIEQQEQTQSPKIAEARQSQIQQKKIRASKAEQQEQDEQPVITASAKKSSGKSQPRMETFKPYDSRTDNEENYSGTIQGIRWTASEGTHKKIRAVVMADEGSDPQVFMDKGKLHALFSSSLENSKSIASPYAENVKAEIKSSVDGAELIFTPEGITKAEKLVLNNPRRIVFEFFYSEEANIAEPESPSAKTDIQLPGQVTETQTAKTPTATPTPTPMPSESAGKSATIVIDNSESERSRTPATMTPPSMITIPTSSKAAEKLKAEKSRKIIVIDPGHGGKDPGASHNGIMEKDINLAVGLEIHRALTARGYNPVMTRATDVYLTLQERTDIANNVEADLFVSVHVNALPKKKSTTGFEIYIMALPTDKDAMELAKIENREYVEGKGMDTANVDRKTEMLLRILGDMQQNNKISESTDFAAMLYNAGVRNGLRMRRVAQAPFFVLRGAGMPAVLLEVGFVTNENEAQLLTTQAYQQRIADAMSEGIANYLR